MGRDSPLNRPFSFAPTPPETLTKIWSNLPCAPAHIHHVALPLSSKERNRSKQEFIMSSKIYGAIIGAVIFFALGTALSHAMTIL